MPWRSRGRDVRAKLESHDLSSVGASWRARTLQFAALPGKFALVGAANTLLDLVLFLALVYLAGLRPTPANGISYSCGIINGFVLNKHWTFKATRRQGVLHRQFAIFALVNLVGLSLATVIVWGLAEPLGPPLAKLVAIGGTFGWNYTTSRHLVFSDRRGGATVSLQ